MESIKHELQIIKRTAKFCDKTVPQSHQRYEQSQKNIWIRLIVKEGELILHTINDQHRQFTITPDKITWMSPKEIYKMECKTSVKFFIEYYHTTNLIKTTTSTSFYKMAPNVES